MVVKLQPQLSGTDFVSHSQMPQKDSLFANGCFLKFTCVWAMCHCIIQGFKYICVKPFLVHVSVLYWISSSVRVCVCVLVEVSCLSVFFTLNVSAAWAAAYLVLVLH